MTAVAPYLIITAAILLIAAPCHLAAWLRDRGQA